MQRAKSTLTNHFNAASFLFGQELLDPFFHVGDVMGQFFCTSSDPERKKRPRSARAKGPTCFRGLPRRSRTESQHCKAQGVLHWVSLTINGAAFGSLLGQVFQNENVRVRSAISTQTPTQTMRITSFQPPCHDWKYGRLVKSFGRFPKE